VHGNLEREGVCMTKAEIEELLLECFCVG